MTHLNRKQHRMEMRSNFTEIVSSINKINDFTVKNISYLKKQIVSTRNILKNNITSVLLMARGAIKNYKFEMGKNITELQTQLFKTNEQLNLAFTGKHMYWGKCPQGWNETGGIYPVKVCIYN